MTNRASLEPSSRDSHLTAVSLFSCAGIGEKGLDAAGVDILASNEIDEIRHALYAANFPDTKRFTGSIWDVKDQLVSEVRKTLGKKELFLVYATPPCQGMSTNGIGRLRKGIRDGERPSDDPRNLLIIPTMDIICALNPQWVLLENVPGMLKTEISISARERIRIVDYIRRRLGADYEGGAEIVQCDRLGLPQSRRRLFTIFTRSEGGKRQYFSQGMTFFPESLQTSAVSLRQAIAHLPPLDSREGFESAPSFHPLHRVPVMQPEKYWWVSNTPEGETAFNNQCINPNCGYDLNPRHKEEYVDGVMRPVSGLPVTCVSCGERLPRPSMVEKDSGEVRALKGFHSAYKRMSWDKPAATLTQNFIYEASDKKIHPSQNRVLSLLEALIVQGADRYDFDFSLAGRQISNALFAEILGESVPPSIIEGIVRRMIASHEGS